MATNIFITWTEEVQEFDRFVSDKYGQPERMFTSKPVSTKAAWMWDVPDESVAYETERAQQYVAGLIADGDTRNLKVKVVQK